MRPMPELEIRELSVADLVPYANNAKEHPEKQVDEIAASIAEFGNCDPVGVWHNEQGRAEIVEGHGRVLALQKLGIETVPVIYLDHLTDEQRRVYTHVHNQTTLSSTFDYETLVADMDNLNADWESFGFEAYCCGEAPDEWCERTGREERPFTCPGCGGEVEGTPNACPDCGYLLKEDEEYNAFVEKFRPKKTTDDCYTPVAVYDAVADWVAGEFGVSRDSFVRPFYPGGDYEAEGCPPGCIVVDNPPFSLMARIIRFYLEHGVRFFLFAPTLTLFSGRNLDVCYIAADCGITYMNGAVVNTSFITNLDAGNTVRTAPALHAAVMEADRASRAERAKPANLRYRYPADVITAAMVAQWSGLGVDFRVPKGHAFQVGGLDAQKPVGKAIYGSGFLLSEAARADAEAARAVTESAKALQAAKDLEADVDIDERTGEVIWRLSDREREIVRSLG